MAVHGTRNRESVSWDYAGVLEVLRNVARDHTGLPLLRCYWYEATVEGRRSSEHEILADLPGVKLRLGKMKPGRREGVESEIHRDLTTLARNRAISDALVVSAEDDLAQVIAEVQDLGLRVILVHIAAPGWTAAAALRQECDGIVEISEAHLRPSVELVVGAEPVGEEDRQAVPAYASRAPANGHGTPGVLGQPALPVGSHAAPPGLYTGPVIAEYQRAAQPANSHRPPRADAPGAAVAGNQNLTSRARPAAGDGAAARCGGPAWHGTGRHARPARRLRPARPATSTAGSGRPREPAGARGPAGRAIRAGRPAALPSQEAAPGQHAAPPGHHAAPGHHPAGPPQHAASGSADDAAGSAARPPAAHISGPLTAPRPAAPPQHAQALPRGGGQHAGPPSVLPIRARRRPAFPARAAATAVHARAAECRAGHAGTARARAARGSRPWRQGSSRPSASPAPRPAGAPGHARLPGSPAASATRGGAGSPGALAPSAAPPGFPGHPAELRPGRLRPYRGRRRPVPRQARPWRPPPGAVPAGPMAQPGQQPHGAPGGYPAALPARPPGAAGDQRARQFPVAPGQPDVSPHAPYVPPQGPHSGPQPAAQHALVPQPVAVSLADAVQAAHGEGFNFGQAVARDAPALWLEAVLARKPRMPSDLEARLLQDSSLPIDSLLHDEVRHALRRGFWDALERVRH